MTAVRSRWSLIALTSAALAVALAVAGVHSPARVLVILWFVLLCPGMTIVRRLRITDPAAELTLALGLSVALATVVASIGLYSGLWSPGATLAVLVVITVVAAVLP
jgi:uncharacterized membrane protein